MADAENTKLTFPVKEHNKSRALGKIRYWWSWFVAGTLLLVIATPALIFLGLINKRMWLFPLAKWGAKTWLRACGATVKVKGLEPVIAAHLHVFDALGVGGAVRTRQGHESTKQFGGRDPVDSEDRIAAREQTC